MSRWMSANSETKRSLFQGGTKEVVLLRALLKRLQAAACQCTHRPDAANKYDSKDTRVNDTLTRCHGVSEQDRDTDKLVRMSQSSFGFNHET